MTFQLEETETDDVRQRRVHLRFWRLHPDGRAMRSEVGLPGLLRRVRLQARGATLQALRQGKLV